MKTLQKGFTLIELMIVIAIIGILAAIAIPQYQNYITRSDVSRVMSETGSLRTAVEDCYVNGISNTCALGAVQSNLVAGALVAVDEIAANGLNGLRVQIGNAAGDDPAAVIGARFGNNAVTAITGQVIGWVRDDEGTWTCHTDVDVKFAPAGCDTASGAELTLVTGLPY